MDADAVTMWVLLSRRDTLGTDRFFQYWQDVHGPLAARLPGLDYYGQHHLQAARGWWPAMAGVGDDPGPGDEIEGVAEMSFLNGADFAAFGRLAHHIRADEQNLFRRSLRYMTQDRGRAAFVGARGVAAGRGCSFNLVAMLRKRPQIAADAFDAALHDIVAPALLASSDLGHLRVIGLKERDNSQNHLLSRHVDHDAPAERQYQGVLELGFTDAFAARRFMDGEALAAALPLLEERLAAFHLYRRLALPEIVTGGRMTLSGLRGHSTAELIRACGAAGQLHPELMAMFCDAALGRVPTFGEQAGERA